MCYNICFATMLIWAGDMNEHQEAKVLSHFLTLWYTFFGILLGPKAFAQFSPTSRHQQLVRGASSLFGEGHLDAKLAGPDAR